MKLHYIKGLLILVSLISFNLSSLGQVQHIEQSTELILVTDGINQNWNTYFENDIVKIEYQSSLCDPEIGYDNVSICLKISNKTNQDIEFNWHSDLYYNDVCRTCSDEYEHMTTYNISANSFIKGECNLNDKGLKMFVRFNDPDYTQGAVLTKFQLKNMWYEVIAQ